ncbi:MAG: hypothetical protein ACE5GE_03535, partial [Phycisphaerae bacterium]
MFLCVVQPQIIQAAPPQAAPSVQYWRTTDGYAMLEAGADAGRSQAGLTISVEPSSIARSSLYPLNGVRGLAFRTVDGRFDRFVDGDSALEVVVRMNLVVDAGAAHLPVGDLQVSLTDQGWQVRDRFNTGRVVFGFEPGAVRFDASAGRLALEGIELSVADLWADELGVPAVAGQTVFVGWIEAAVEAIKPAELVGSDAQADAAAQLAEENRFTIGPDVIVGVLPLIEKLATVNGVSAYAIATTSCNIGTQTLRWEAETSAHPVIAQNLYRYEDGRFEQIGMSWLKHGFCALSDNDCNLGCFFTDCRTLGLGCSDTYGTVLNGMQSNLGPRSDVDPVTGSFPFPFTSPPYSGLLDRRLQVAVQDVDPNLNPNATFVGEAHYVTADDAAAGNGDNNVSWREIAVGDLTGGGFELVFTGSTRQTQPAIQAWPRFDPAVELVDINVPGDGLMILGYKADQLGALVWQYEYAVYNMNSDRAAGSFSIQVSDWADLWDIQFHDVDTHSNELYSNADWTADRSGGALTWSTEPFASNPNANALRWGTLYNFRFKSDARPDSAEATVGIFKPGDPAGRTRTLKGPGQDCNHNDTLDRFDISLFGEPDVNSNGVPDSCEAPIVLAVNSCKDHGSAGTFCFDMHGNDIESRAGGVSRLVVQLSEPMDAATVDGANVSVVCSATAYSGVVATALQGNSSVLLNFQPPLPDQECCRVDMTGIKSLIGVGVSGSPVVRSLQGDIDRNGRVTTG